MKEKPCKLITYNLERICFLSIFDDLNAETSDEQEL
jgi:hypothetical protein